MVVTRRAPAPPLPASRAQSAQHVPRIKGKALPIVPDASSPLVNGKNPEDSDEQHERSDETGQLGSDSAVKESKSKAQLKSKKAKKKPAHTAGFLDLLSKVLLLWLFVYALVVCPDAQHKSLLCRGIAEYRRLVLDSYVFPPLQLVLAHPSVAPYVERARPYTNRAIAMAKPIARRTSREWNARVVPQWNKRVVPLWRTYALPQVERLDMHVAPYRARVVDQYQRRVEPCIQQVSPYVTRTVHTLRRWQHGARPYIVLTVHKTYDGYQRVSPYAKPVWDQFKSLVKQLIAGLTRQRQQFVDPHVQKIWERVKELSSGKSRISSVAGPRDYITIRGSNAESEATSVRSTSVSVSLGSASPPASSVFDNTEFLNVVPVSKSLPSYIESAFPTFSPSEVEEVATSVVSELLYPARDTASSLLTDTTTSVSPTSSFSGSSFLRETGIWSASPSAADMSSSASFLASPITEQSSIAISLGGAAPSLSSSVSTVAGQPAASVTLVATPLGSAVSDDDTDVDLDAFYAELGLQDVIADATRSDAEAPPRPSVKAESDGEKAERLRIRAKKMADKRADIMARHQKWEGELAAQIQASTDSLRQALLALRKDAALELKDSYEIRAEVENLVEEAEKYLRGAEKYLQTLRYESRTDEEKHNVWERVTDKVDEKFAERLGQTEAVVNGWFMTVVDKELAEVRKVAAAVKDIADRGQTDIGMDYAYLDDVTYQDWERYHDLLKKSGDFADLAHAIQNGTDSSPVLNPVVTEIEDLQAEVQDVVVGFETRLRRIKRNGERTLSGSGPEVTAEPENESASILPIEDAEKTQAPTDVNIPPVVIGRSKEEILGAFDRAAEQAGQATSPQDASLRDVNAAISGIAEQVTGETHPSRFQHHQEL
ncbi:uncharacterized protein FIBRA_04669 [Fibroporia radiculosa]|uniref:Uncharacterized protein n=1 Tax=Fibroporia radiculosa TaxID=599839 RepID=J4IAA4_9APHY|nr:uncharacterized protein FIBRA_04669 [Fibroporia radiculosa]CCM02566.1 predicted protein [Fibroporia radiculosa]